MELRHSGEKLTMAGIFKTAMVADPEGLFDIGYGSAFSVEYRFGFRTGTNPYDSFSFSSQAYLNDLIPGLRLSVKMPRLLWWRCDGPNVTNLPSVFTLDASFTNDYSALNLTGSAKVVLYSREIQWSPAFMGLYFQRFALSAGYSVSYITGDDSLFSHKANASALFYMTPIVGSYLTKLQVGLGATVEKNLLSPWDEGWQFTVAFGLN